MTTTVSVLGSTGSIGTQTLDICREYSEHFQVISLSAGSNVELLAKQIAELRGMTSEQIAEITSKNFDTLFKKQTV